MANFEKSWSTPLTPGFKEQISGVIHKEGPLKPRVEGATRTLNQPISKLDSITKKLSEKDTKLFQKIVEAHQSKDKIKAKILANELSELRKHEKVVGNMRLSIERVQMRLSTVNELGDMMHVLGPAMSAMKAMGPALTKFIPEADAEFSAMGNMLGGLMTNSFEGSFDSGMGSNEEADLILQEASAVAQTQIGEKFPTVPTTISSGLSSTANE